MIFSRQRSCSTSHGRLHSMHVNCSRTETDSGGSIAARLSRARPASVQGLWKLWVLWKTRSSVQPFYFPECRPWSNRMLLYAATSGVFRLPAYPVAIVSLPQNEELQAVDVRHTLFED